MNEFTFYVDGDKFFDLKIDELALINPVLELETNAAGTLEFTMPPTHPKIDSIKPLTSTIEIKRDGEWFWEGRLINNGSDFYNEHKFTIEGALSYLNDSYQPQFEYHGTVIGYVERILNVHNSQVPDNRKIYLGAVTVQDPNNYIYRYTNYETTLGCLKQDITDDLGGIIRLRKVNGKLYMDVLAETDRTCAQVIRIGQNLIDLSPNTDYSDVVSVIVPLGATLEEQEDYSEGLEALDKYVTIAEVNGGKEYIGREDLINQYNNIFRVVQFSDIHTPENLLRKAKEYLTDGQWGQMIIEAKAFDLNYTSEEFQEFRLNDKIRVKSELHNIDRYFPLTSQTIVFNDPAQNTITLGGTGEPVSITGVTNKVTINTEKLSERIKDPNRLIQQAIYQATELINQGLNGYVRVNGNEILIMDTNDPATAKHVWRWNMGGLGYSNNGYNGPFETAITMDGTIVGKFIAANSIAAEQIDVNYRSHIIQEGKEYVDGKLVNYSTTKETETYFNNLGDGWVMGVLSDVDTKLGDYTTKEYLASQLTLTDERFNTTLIDYSTTKQVQSMIDQTAESITTSVGDRIDGLSSQITQTKNDITEYVGSEIDGCYSEIKQTKDEITTTLKGYAKTGDLSELEQKVTTEGIFTTINSGLAGTKSFKTTKFTMDKNGLSIQNGALSVKNNSGTSVLYSDTSGNLSLQGNIYHHYNGNQAVDITGHKINFYAYNQSGNYVGSIGAAKDASSSTPNITFWSDYGDDIIIGSYTSSSSSTIQGIIKLGSSGGKIGIKEIAGTLTGTFNIGNSSITYEHGLITDRSSNATGISGTFNIGNSSFTYKNGCITGIGSNAVGVSGTFTVGNSSFTYKGGCITSINTNPTGISDTVNFGEVALTFKNGCLTSSTGTYGVTGTEYVGAVSLNFKNGVLTSSSGTYGYNGTVTINDLRLTFNRGCLTKAENI